MKTNQGAKMKTFTISLNGAVTFSEQDIRDYAAANHIEVGSPGNSLEEIAREDMTLAKAYQPLILESLLVDDWYWREEEGE